MTKLKYLLAFIVLSGIITFLYVVWFFKFIILIGMVIYVLYRIDSGYKQMKTKLKLKKEK